MISEKRGSVLELLKEVNVNIAIFSDVVFIKKVEIFPKRD